VHGEHKKLQLEESVTPHSHLLDLLHIVVPAAQQAQYQPHRINKKVAQQANVIVNKLTLFSFSKPIFYAMSQQALSASSTENSAQCLENFFSKLDDGQETGHNYMSTFFVKESHFIKLSKNKNGRKGQLGPGERFFRNMGGTWPND
jgi:hypothetical protein